MRLEVKFSTTYDSDLHKTRAAAVKAAHSVEQVLKTPPPVCHLTGYGATAIDYVLWFWIKDAATGPTGVRSAVMIALWDTFEREGVKLPKPGAVAGHPRTAEVMHHVIPDAAQRRSGIQGSIRNLALDSAPGVEARRRRA